MFTTAAYLFSTVWCPMFLLQPEKELPHRKAVPGAIFNTQELFSLPTSGRRRGSMVKSVVPETTKGNCCGLGAKWLLV